jgi:hypothetical protein
VVNIVDCSVIGVLAGLALGLGAVFRVTALSDNSTLAWPAGIVRGPVHLPPGIVALTDRIDYRRAP